MISEFQPIPPLSESEKKNAMRYSPDAILPTEDALSEKVVVQPRKESLVKRMNRITGQVNGVTRMIEQDRYCVDILTQISAVKSALDAVALQLLENHTRHCVKNAIKEGSGEDSIQELLDIVKKFIR